MVQGLSSKSALPYLPPFSLLSSTLSLPGNHLFPHTLSCPYGAPMHDSPRPLLLRLLSPLLPDSSFSRNKPLFAYFKWHPFSSRQRRLSKRCDYVISCWCPTNATPQNVFAALQRKGSHDGLSPEGRQLDVIHTSRTDYHRRLLRSDHEYHS